MFGYRTEQLYGEGYRDAAEIMAHEVFELGNTDILDTLSETILKNTPTGVHLRLLSKAIDETIEDDMIKEFLDECYDDECARGVEYFKEVLSAIKDKTGKDVKYALWLCDSIEDIKKEYECPEVDYKLTEFDKYEKSDIVLSDLGLGGKLYGYEVEPEPCD